MTSARGERERADLAAHALGGTCGEVNFGPDRKRFAPSAVHPTVMSICNVILHGGVARQAAAQLVASQVRCSQQSHLISDTVARGAARYGADDERGGVSNLHAQDEAVCLPVPGIDGWLRG